MRMCVCGCVR
uniref:Uncharacterized protein n=1 Tax=Amphimedon queenslandica TaxID=400682 RepID=A0A1X7TGD0_AMPQE